MRRLCRLCRWGLCLSQWSGGLRFRMCRPRQRPCELWGLRLGMRRSVLPRRRVLGGLRDAHRVYRLMRRRDEQFESLWSLRESLRPGFFLRRRAMPVRQRNSIVRHRRSADLRCQLRFDGVSRRNREARRPGRGGRDEPRSHLWKLVRELVERDDDVWPPCDTRRSRGQRSHRQADGHQSLHGKPNAEGRLSACR